MAIWLQHGLTLAIVAVALTLVARQGFAALRGRKSRLGSCCATGCSAVETKPKAAGERLVFLPLEQLSARSRRKPSA